MKLSRLVASALPTLLLASTAHAVRQPDYLAERPLEVASNSPARNAMHASYAAPAPTRAAWRQFLAQHGHWKALWDLDTGVARRIFGEGIAAPGAVADGAKAEAVARRVLADHLDLLAPGARAEDFEVTFDVVRGEGTHTARVVSMAQSYKGLPVVDGGVSFLFKQDRLILFGSTATADVAPVMPSSIVDAATAGGQASAWIRGIYGGDPQVTAVGEPVVLPLIPQRGAVSHRVVVPVTVDLQTPRALWTVYVDAGTGAPVARKQRLMFAQGTVNYHVPQRYPDGGYMDYPAAYATHSVNGSSATADVAGLITWATGVATVAPGLAGTYARIFNASGQLTTGSLTLNDGGTATWDQSSNGLTDAQLNAYVHATIAKRFSIDTLDPSLSWLSQQIPVYVNENDVCNAYSNLDDIHFFIAGSTQGITCENTGRMADVVYHEFGHSLHNQSKLYSADIDGGMSEGVSDYLAATITNDHGMGRGFFAGDPSPLRDIDPPGEERVWPDDQSFDPHETGLIIAGALWDLRKALIADLGAGPGQTLADDIYYAVISRAQDIPSSYAEALAEDDDDGNLANGTPHQCAIDAAFAAHGLADVSLAAGSIDPPTQVGFALTLQQADASGGDCPAAQITSAVVHWKLRADPATSGDVDFTDGGATFTATLPSQDDGTVIQYQVVATMSDGNVKAFPLNAADQWYEMYVGPVTELYCTDFESTDPTADGWVFTNQFEWGAPSAPAGNSDPTAAFSGTKIVGMNLAGDYQDMAQSEATMPEIDTTGFETVRLQYRRWLGVEDALYDHATINADGAELWSNLDTPGGTTQHRDREWRFQDVDLSPLAADGKVTVKFHLDSDESLGFGGWSLDDVCIVGVGPAVCGDGFVTDPEQCDDGNVVDGDGCSATCTTETPATCGDGINDEVDCPTEEPGGCCSTGGHGGAGGPLLLGLATLLGLSRRRRR